MNDESTAETKRNPEPVNTTVKADSRVFPIGIGNETFLNIDGLDSGRVRIRHEHDQIVIIVCEENRDSNRDVAERIEMTLTEEIDSTKP